MNDIDYDWMNNLLIFSTPVAALFVIVKEILVRKKKLIQMI